MGVEKARNLSHLSLESIPKSITNENGSVEYDPSIENHLQMNGNVGDIKEVSEKNCVKLPEESEKLIEMENGKEVKYELVPPDGGYAWLVLFGAMLVNILIPGGAIKSFGILFVEFLENLNASPSSASWIPAICYFLYSSLGPLSSILSVKYSYRTVTFIGSAFCSFGLIMTYFTNSIEYLYISYGVCVGIGAGLTFPPTVYIVTSYFVKLRGLANGLCISGSALGSIFLPPILRVLLDNFGYRGACLIMGGITLNCFIAALFYDDVSKHLKRVRVEDNDEEELQEDLAAGKSFRNDKILEDVEEEPSEGMENGTKKLAKFILTHDDCATPIANTPTMDYKHDIFKYPKNSFERSISAVMSNDRTRKISTPMKGGDNVQRNGTVTSFTTQLNSNLSLTDNHNSSMRLHRLNSNRVSSRPKGLKASPSTSSFQYISTPYHGTLSSLQPNEFSSHLSLRSIASSFNPMTTCRKSDTKKEEEQSGCDKYFDLSLLRDPGYLILLISNCTNAISYTNFIILLPSYALELGFTKDQAAYLLSIVSTFDLIGRIGGSALSDLNLIPKSWFFVGGLVISGFGLTGLPFVAQYGWVSAICSIFGLATGTYVGITSIVMVDMLGAERLTSSYGISLFVNGILQLLGPPICLSAFERIGEFQPIFFVLGLTIIAGSSLWCFMPCVQNRKKAKLAEAQQELMI
ncbi:monocarboxylate transporter 12-B [Chironomus tepperi]|uniref:monocarboxylate transporter 12-B n=1 Tax=Chironomus tepperi TaxID=113505 RepID=UPI00391F6A41